MERTYRWILVGILVLVLGFGIWYVISEYQKDSTYENGVLVRTEMEAEHGTGNYIYESFR